MNIEEIPIAELDLDPANVRQHDEKNLAAIKSSLKRFGQQKPIVVDPKGIVIAGNGTLTAARALGWDRIRAYAIADNRTAELATWDDDALMQQLSALDLEDSALVEAAGFSAAQLEDMVNALLGPDFEPDSESNQSRLDELAPKIVECPHCKKEFDAREA
jgi:ParB-like chromosome segregation protein Spo0J